MSKALRSFGWPVSIDVPPALLIIQRDPKLASLPRQEVHVEQAPLLSCLQEGPVSYTSAVNRAAPTVASPYTTKIANKPSYPLFDGPMFRRFFGDNLSRQKRMEPSLGPVVIMSAEGYLLTNNHVTAGANQIVVALCDGHKTTAQLVGNDLETDLAVLKIDSRDLPTVTLDRPDGIRTGDVYFTIDNSLDVGQTATMGIVSAAGRNQLGLNTYEDFAQTGAAINPGNSGGVLMDAAGNLVGINMAILSKSGSSQGVGSAIPIRLALEVMQPTIEHGQVIRDWLGVEIKALTTELAEFLGLGETARIVVAGVYRDGPAVRSGLLLGDMTPIIDKQEANDGHRSMNRMACVHPGQKISITVLRNGQKVDLIAEVDLCPPPAPTPQQKQDDSG